MRIEVHKAVIVLVDIGGYTRYVKSHLTAMVHAEKNLTELLESVIKVAAHPLSLNKLEGDAAMFFARAEGNGTAVVRSALLQVAGFFRAFAEKRAALGGSTMCHCPACKGVDMLTIKVIVHFGDVAFKRVSRFQELAGETVIVAHRLLKNSSQRSEYVLVTVAADTLAGGLFRQPSVQTSELCEGIGPVRVVVYDPPPMLPVEARRPSFGRRVLQTIALDLYTVKRVMGLTVGAVIGWFRRGVLRPSLSGQVVQSAVVKR